MDFDIINLSKSNFEFLYKIFSSFSFFYLFWFSILVFIFIYHAALHRYILSPAWIRQNPELPLLAWIPGPIIFASGIGSDIVKSFVFTAAIVIVFTKSFLSIRYDFTQIYTLFVGDFVNKASGWKKLNIAVMNNNDENKFLDRLFGDFGEKVCKVISYFLSSGRWLRRV